MLRGERKVVGNLRKNVRIHDTTVARKSKNPHDRKLSL